MMVHRNRFRFRAAAVSAACVLGFAGQVFAQEAANTAQDNSNVATNGVDSASFDRGRNVSVRQRVRPEYAEMGIHAGGFMIYPKANVSVAHDDNIYAVHTGAVGDTITTAAPEIDIKSTWSRNALSAYIKAQQDWFAKYTKENATQYSGGVAGKLELGRSTLSAGADSGRYTLPRSASNNSDLSIHPIQYDLTNLNAQLAHEFARLRVSARVDYQIYKYQNGETAAHATVFEKDQSHTALIYSSKAEFAVTPDTAVFVTASGNNQNYDLNPPTVAFTRNGSGYEVDGGANFDISHLVRGEVQLGYLNQNYVSPQFNTISGLSGKGVIEWFPTPLTTVTLQASRSVANAGIVGSAGYLTSNGGIQVDHELMRNLILTASGWYGYDQYQFDSPNFSRNDTRAGVSASANWLLNRRVGLVFAYTHSSQWSSGTLNAVGPSFTDNRVSVTSVLQF